MLNTLMQNDVIHVNEYETWNGFCLICFYAVDIVIFLYKHDPFI